MTKENFDCFILGNTHKGTKFRPSDWIDRIAALFASFNTSRRLQYHTMIRPAMHKGLRCLFVAGSLALADPIAYDFVMDFAQRNQLQIVERGQAMAGQQPQVELSNVA
jgi:hypothetical protein